MPIRESLSHQTVVWVKQWVLSDSGLVGVNGSIDARVDFDFITAQERFAQVGVELRRESAPQIIDVKTVALTQGKSDIVVATAIHSPSVDAKAIILEREIEPQMAQMSTDIE